MNYGITVDKKVSSSGLIETNYQFQIKSRDTLETNVIMTSKFNWYNFLPKILFTQFYQLINWYFFIISICEVIKLVLY